MSAIEWTEATWNPVIGCELASPGCANCYAATMARRQVAMAEGRGAVSPYADVVHIGEPGDKNRRGAGLWSGATRFLPERLGDPLGWRKGRMVFAPSMSDFFHESVDFEHVAAIFGVMAATPQHTYQVLTKRPARLLEFLRDLESQGWQLLRPPLERVREAAWAALDDPRQQSRVLDASRPLPTWPLPNVWLGVSVEDQKRADKRLPLLAEVRAMGWHTFVSAEPLIGLVEADWSAAEWVIVGGESGHHARRCEAEWMRRVVRDAVRAGASPFVKQLGLRFSDPRNGIAGAGLDVHPDAHVTRRLKSRKGSDPAEWPADLRVREWPAAMRGAR